MFTNFYMSNSVGGTGGSDLNSGSTFSATPKYTSLAGGWINATGVFTPTDGSNPSNFVAVGDWVSVYPTGTSPTPFVGQVTGVGATTVTVSLVDKFGTAPANQIGTANLIDGGAFADFGMFASGAALNTGTITQSTLFNIQAGTYANGATTYTCALAGTTAFPLEFSGFQTTPGDQINNFNPSLGTNIPLTTSSNTMSFSGAYVTLRSLAFTSTNINTTLVIGGTHAKLSSVNVQNTNAASTSAAVSFSGVPTDVLLCNFGATTTASAVVTVAATTMFDSCVISGGIVGISMTSIGVLVANSLFTGQAGDSLTGTTGTQRIINNAFYNVNGNGLNMTSTGSAYVRGNYFEGIPSGKYAINSSGATTGNITGVANGLFTTNGGGEYNGLGDTPLFFDNGMLPSAGFVAPASLNFGTNSVLWGIGFPRAFLNLPSTLAFSSLGAAQPTGSGGVLMTVRRVRSGALTPGFRARNPLY